MVYVFLADGFEEAEALVPVDILRRAGVSVQTVGVGTATPTGSHGICVKADVAEEEIDLEEMDALILPGGMPGTRNLEGSSVVQAALDKAYREKLPMGAICAAPSIFGHKGFLQDRLAICYPGLEDALIGATVSSAPVVTDGWITTAKGPGVSLAFGLEMAERLTSKETAQAVKAALQCS